MLGSSEDNTALSRALSQLAEVEEKIEQLHQEQANNDFFLLAELLSDYIRLLSVVRVSVPGTLLISGRFLWSEAQEPVETEDVGPGCPLCSSGLENCPDLLIIGWHYCMGAEKVPAILHKLRVVFAVF